MHLKVRDLPLPEWVTVGDPKLILQTAKLLRVDIVKELASRGNNRNTHFLCHRLLDLSLEGELELEPYSLFLMTIDQSLEGYTSLEEAISNATYVSTFGTLGKSRRKKLYLRLLWLKKLIKELENALP